MILQYDMPLSQCHDMPLSQCHVLQFWTTRYHTRIVDVEFMYTLSFVLIKNLYKFVHNFTDLLQRPLMKIVIVKITVYMYATISCPNIMLTFHFNVHFLL